MNPASTWKNEITSRLLSRDYAPRIRSDAQLTRLVDTSGVRLSDPRGALWLDLSPPDYDLVHRMDGIRSMAWLAEFARRQDPVHGPGRVERLIVELYSRELLVPIEPPEGQAGPAGWEVPGPRKEGKIVPLPARRAPAYEEPDFREEMSDAFSDRSTVARSRMLAAPRAVGSSAGAYVPAYGGDADEDPEATTVGAPPEAAAEEAEDASAPDPAAADAEPSDGDEEQADGEADPGVASETSDGVEAEQQALWEEMRSVKWHQRGWVRVLLVLGGLTVISAIVPYPLRVNSEAVIIPSERAYVRSKTAGILVEIRADEGQSVHKGDVLARLDDRELRTERLKAQAEVERSEAEIALLKRGARAEEIAGQRAVVAAAGNEVAFARKEAARKARMTAQGVGSAQVRDQARHELRLKQKALAEASARLRLLQAGTRVEEVKARQAELDRAKAHLAFVEEQLALTVIQAPIDGILLTRKFRERLHEKIDAGGLVCEIAKTDRMRAEVYLSEREMDSVALGQPVVVKVQSYPTHEFTGKVDFLAPAVEKRGDENRMRVVAELANDEGLLRQDMTGYGEIDCGRRSVLNLVTRRILRWVRVRFLL